MRLRRAWNAVPRRVVHERAHVAKARQTLVLHHEGALGVERAQAFADADFMNAVCSWTLMIREEGATKEERDAPTNDRS